MSEQDLKLALQAWAKARNLRPSEFARATGYSYNHAYQVLEGEAAVSAETLGRVALAYGGEAVVEIEGLAKAQAAELLKGRAL
jgi:transcriptional regulator with XRE-family HTH domain